MQTLKRIVLVFGFLATAILSASAQSKKICVIAYYAGDDKTIDNYKVEDLTHIIFSFCHLEGNRMAVANKKDSATIQHLVALRKRNPSLKIILSMGGWGGCEPCSAVFATERGRNEFAASVLELNKYFGTNGIDLDWEYPAIEGYPGHQYLPEDKHNFTLLLQALRKTLGKKYEISFAAGGFTKFLDESIEWKAIAPIVDKVNLMTYDLVHGFSKITGHHTPLYSTPEQKESCDNAVHYLDSIGFPVNKLVIGAAFYGRIFNTTQNNNGLYQPGSFDHGISYRDLDMDKMKEQGYVYFWDDVAKAPYMFNQKDKKIFTYDNKESIALKTKYAIDKGLNGIMFWQLADDKPTDGLLSAITAALK